MYVEMPAHLTEEGLRRAHVPKLHSRLYRFRDAARIQRDYLLNQTDDLEL